MAADVTEGDNLSKDVPERRIVEFRLGTERYAIDVDHIERIVEVERVTRLPRAPSAIDGLIDLRGEITAVIDPRELFSVGPPISSDLDPRILVFDLPDEPQPVGMHVDAVLAVDAYPEYAIERGEVVEEMDSDALEQGLLRGVIRDEEGDGVVAWVDPEGIVDATSVDTGSIDASSLEADVARLVDP